MPSDPYRRVDSFYTPSRSNNDSSQKLNIHSLCNLIRRDNDIWFTEKVSLQELCTVVKSAIPQPLSMLIRTQQESVPEILLVFLPEVPGLLHVGVHIQLSEKFKIPDRFWSPVAQNASGVFSCQDTRDVSGGLERFNSHLRFLIKEPVRQDQPLSADYPINVSYVWHRLGIYITWTPSNGIVVLCFGLPLSLRKPLSDLAQLRLEDPFSFHAILLEKVITFYDITLWSWRDIVRDMEKNRACPNDPQPDYVIMHETARHIIHTLETLAMALEITSRLIEEHEIFFEENQNLPIGTIILSKQNRRTFRSQLTLFKCIHLRSKALEERLRNEINLAFNTVAQHDSRIAVLSSKATQIDSAAMKTISVLGLVFLPGTFICALFSTSFFNFSPGSIDEPQRWSVSERFWIYWAVAIPVTLVTVACWVSWQRAYNWQRLD